MQLEAYELFEVQSTHIRIKTCMARKLICLLVLTPEVRQFNWKIRLYWGAGRVMNEQRAEKFMDVATALRVLAMAVDKAEKRGERLVD